MSRALIVVQTVESWIGASLKDRADDLKAFISRGHNDQLNLLTPQVSSCGLFALAVWFAVGVDHELVRARYQTGKAITWIEHIASDLGAVRHVKHDGPPSVGSLLHYYSKRPSYNDHVEFLLSEPNARGLSKHAGGGRKDCKVGAGEDNLSWNGGRPLQVWYDLAALLPEPPPEGPSVPDDDLGNSVV